LNVEQQAPQSGIDPNRSFVLQKTMNSGLDWKALWLGGICSNSTELVMARIRSGSCAVNA